MTGRATVRPVGTAGQPRASVRVAFVAIMALFLAFVVEGGARLVYAYKDRVAEVMPGLLALHEYQVKDETHPSHWRLRAGFVESYQEAAEASKRARRILGQQFIADSMKRESIPEDQVFVRINSHGFRGPEIDKTHSRWRILTIGDSCTFGTSEVHNYPRSLERNLRRLDRDVEVINGGVEGYAPRNVLFRIDEFQALQPEIATIYIGWNALYSEVSNPLSPARTSLYSLRLFGQAYGLITQMFGDRQKAALAAYRRPKHPDPHAAALKYLDGYVPPFVSDVERIVDELIDPRRQVVLLTLPGLYAPDEAPGARALEVGHLPTFTDNPYFLAKMAAQYNDALRRLAERKGVPLIDLDTWSKTALQPRDKYFFDSVHLYDDGQEKIGAYMAEQLLRLVPREHRHDIDSPSS